MSSMNTVMMFGRGSPGLPVEVVGERAQARRVRKQIDRVMVLGQCAGAGSRRPVFWRIAPDKTSLELGCKIDLVDDLIRKIDFVAGVIRGRMEA